MGVIQRAPRGLYELLSLKGQDSLPTGLEMSVRPTIDILQLYGLQQVQIFNASNAALAEGGSVSVTLAGLTYGVLFGVVGNVIKTGTMTACELMLSVNRNNTLSLAVAQREFSPFGATETGNAVVTWQPPYPWILVPPWNIACTLNILGTDATANVGVTAEIGILG